jgi:hypothetical protein
MTGIRQKIMKAAIQLVARVILYSTGYFWIDVKQDLRVCYKQYLGPEWEKKW